MRTKVGHIYVVQLADGLVKVGKTTNPKYRISRSGFGNREIIDFWVSEQFVGHSESESALIDFMNGAGTLELGREYFSGVSYSDAVLKAKSLVGDTSSEAIQKRKDFERINDEAFAKKIMKVSEPKGYDADWVAHVNSHLSVVSLIESVILNEGINSNDFEPVDSLGGISTFSLSLLLVSYRVGGDKIDYFNDILSSLYEVIFTDSKSLLDWVVGFSSEMNSGVKRHYQEAFED